MEKSSHLHPLLASQCLAALDDVRDNKVKRLKALIDAGKYAPDLELVAESLFVSRKRKEREPHTSTVTQ